MSCYCGKPVPFEQCCQKIINQQTIALTPEQLMRSRYSAYATKNAAYLYQTYAEQSRKTQSIDDIQTWAAQTTWLRLTIVTSDNISLQAMNNQVNESLPIVHFKAFYFYNKTPYLMEEKSRFIVEDNQWRYLDGDVITDVALATPKRNDPCFCQSGLKFKRCCATKC